MLTDISDVKDKRGTCVNWWVYEFSKVITFSLMIDIDPIR